MAVKCTIPFDSLTAAEECRVKQKKMREAIEVRFRGVKVERIYRWLEHNQTTIIYGGEELLVRGDGFNRFINV